MPFAHSKSNSFSCGLSRSLVRHRLIFMFLGVAIGLISVERSRHLEYSQSIDAMFDRSDSALPPFRRLGRTFGASSVVLAVYDEPDLFQPSGFARLDELTQRLSHISDVHTATSLATTPLGAGIIHTDTNPTAENLVKLMEGYAVGSDRKTAAVICVLREKKEDRTIQHGRIGKTIDAIRSIIEEYPGGTIAGEPVMLRDGFAMLRRDGNVLGITAGILASAVLLILFHSVRWLFAPLAVVLLALWSTRGLLAMAGQKLTMVSTMLSAMVTVVAIATTVHIIVEFRRRLENGEVPQQALTNTIQTLFWPIIAAIITDIIGFGSLIASDVGPVHDFGIMTALGAGMVLVSVGLLVPWFALVGNKRVAHSSTWGQKHLDNQLNHIVSRITQHPKPILSISLGFIIFTGIGLFQLRVETDFTKNFRPESPIVKSYDTIESQLGGAGVWDILIPVKQPIDAQTLARVGELEKRLRSKSTPNKTTQGLTKVLSIVDILDAISPIPLADLQNSSTGHMIVGTAVAFFQQQMPQLATSLIGTDPLDNSTWLRVMLRAREKQPASLKRSLIDRVQKTVTEMFPPTKTTPTGEVTGFFVLLAQLVERMLEDQWLTFLIAAIGIFIFLSFGFQSVVIGGIALIPNILPIIFILGVLGWTGEPINMGTAMIAAVSLGLSVDSSIHYTTAFRRQLSQHGSITEALQSAHQTAGRAMIFSTLALVVGFLALTTSEFIPTVSFGRLSCLTLLGGLVGNLLVLPVLLSLAARRFHWAS